MVACAITKPQFSDGEEFFFSKCLYCDVIKFQSLNKVTVIMSSRRSAIFKLYASVFMPTKYLTSPTSESPLYRYVF